MTEHVPPTTKKAHEVVAIPAQHVAANGDCEPWDHSGFPLARIIEAPPELRGWMLLEALDLDPRPTFIIELKQEYNGGNGRQPELVFYNSALKARPALASAVLAQERKAPAERCWSVATEDHSGDLDSPLMCFGLPWEFYTINGKWRVVSTTSRMNPSFATIASPSSGPTKTTRGKSTESRPQLRTQTSSKSIENNSVSENARSEEVLRQLIFFNFTSVFQSNSIPAMSSEFGQLLFHFDWSTTYLGSMNTWSLQLLEMFKLMLADPRPAMLFWGQHNVMLYNEAFIPLMVDKHPSSIGRTVEMVYKDVWETLHKPLIAQLVATAEAQTHVNTLLCYPKENDMLAEVYADYTSIPVIGSDGCVAGVYQSVVEVTDHTLTQRRTQTLAAIASVAVESRNLKKIWVKIMHGLEANDKDIPQILLYSLDALWGERVDRSRCKLEGSIRRSQKSNIEFENFGLDYEDHVLSKLFQLSMSSDVPLYLDQQKANHRNGELPSDLGSSFLKIVENFGPGSFGDDCASIVIFPIRESTTENPVGFVVWGLNTRQPYNNAYQSFVIRLQQALATAISSGLRWEQEIFRSQTAAEQAELEHASLSAQLQQRIKEARTNELRFQRVVQHGPIGICIYSPDGSMAFANEQWYNMTEFPRDADSTGASWWSPLIFQEDQAYATEMFTRLMIEKLAVHFEIRLVAPPKTISKDKGDSTWVLVSAYPELSSENGLEAIVACFTDITEQKWAAELERNRTEDAVEAKRQQEAFVDITSHEIRNPLSAVLQSAQEINALCRGQLNTATKQGSNLIVPAQDLKDALYAAEIIEQCTLHQKRIVDDILTLSKMDAGLLAVVLAPAQPTVIVDQTMKFFLRELSQAKTEMKFVIDDSYRELDLDWLELDTGRLSQMLINLTTNAIKFTKQQVERQIEVRLGASCRTRPLNTWHLEYLPAATHKIQTVGSDWPEDDCIYLHFSVTDSGIGMTLDEQKTLFARFSQASTRTYTQYGGSGLGLYICRSMVEIHGGQIGFSSMTGVGSTFGFFIRTRRLSTQDVPESSLISSLPSANLAREDPFDIVLVEDNLINQKVLTRQLARIGHSVTIANHGHECLDILRESHFCRKSGSPLSIILMDIEMPVMDGMACAREIRRMQGDGLIHGHVPIIAITGNARDEKVQQAIDAGMDEVVLKPFTLPVLMPLIQRLVKKHRSPTSSAE